MRNAASQREEDIFNTARSLAGTARAAYLRQACADASELEERIARLLAAEAEAELFFAEGSAVLGGKGAAGLGAMADSVLALGEEPIGTRIGRYRLLLKIGEGGCGVVYMADQEEPVRRRVALKIIKLGMETRSIIARFEAERQALAMMDHPNIARVFDAGATERGPPYFVMELVRGVKITEFCDEHRLGLRARLDLFVQVCHAIQHAHQKGIIHGDIKPSNIMVSLQDGAPVPKVIDFGISKATEARLTDKLTGCALLVGTPAYMSPEQAQMSGVDIDTRSDIYSLGVLLYELLAGATPFDAKALLAAGFDELRRTLLETEPLRPSGRLRTLGGDELARVAAARAIEPRILVPRVEGDLDWIAMKALEKDRGRRYETANGLAMDIQRHLYNEPVMARPPSRIYRLQKLVRRNRVVFAAGGAVALALVLGMGTSTWLFLKERDARQRAVAAEQQQVRLREEAEVREKITQAALLVSQERFDEADGLLSGLALLDPTVEGAAVFRALGEWHAFRGRWLQAADRFSALLKVDQLDGLDGATLDSLRCGPVLIESGDIGRYERFRDEAIARFSKGPGSLADRIVKISLLLPANSRVMVSLNPLAEAMAKSLAEADAAGDGFMAAWRSVSLALWEYRRGNYLEAVEWCKRCLAYRDYNNAPRTATARVILAMSLRQLGRFEEADTELAGARTILENKFKQPLTRGTPVQGFWFDWLFARILLREATALAETPARQSG